jgi:class 3 adenylate cyclase
MRDSRDTLLCAALAGDAHTLRRAGARFTEGALSDALEVLRARAAQGLLVRTLSDRIFLRYASPDSAAGAAAAMASAIDALPPFTGMKLSARIGFHCGPMGAEPNDDTTRRVLELVAQAKPGQILTTRSTAELLGTSFRAFSQKLCAAPLAAGPQAAVYEILGRDAR